jgi:tetratricopeptide (TPR) repeat protein
MKIVTTYSWLLVCYGILLGSMQTLSLCMIVRDEAAWLPQFLVRVAGLWDELCVVDTGSVDETTDLVRAAGGRVGRYLWDDDFSAPRNLSLEMATGDWVIVLDADEWVEPALCANARALVNRDDAGAALLPFVHMQPNGTLERTYRLRMFRRLPQLRYRFRLHEELNPELEAYLTRTQHKLVRLGGHVEHWGEAPSRQAYKGVRARDAALWRRTLAENPHDPQGLHEQVAHAVRWDNPSAAAAAARHVLAALRAAPAAHLRQDPQAFRPVVTAAAALGNLDPEAAVSVLEEWETSIPPHLAYYVQRGELRAACDRPSAAAADFGLALKLAHTSYDVQLACIRPHVGLARLYGQQEDYEAADNHVAQALAFDAQDPLALAALADLSLQRGGPAALVTAERAHVRQYGDSRARQVTFAQRRAVRRSP